jgi:hypothetical protein
MPGSQPRGAKNGIVAPISSAPNGEPVKTSITAGLGAAGPSTIARLFA